MKKLFKKFIFNSLFRVLVSLVFDAFVLIKSTRGLWPHSADCPHAPLVERTQRPAAAGNYFKFKIAIGCIFLIVVYISLNNYLIIFIYLKSTSAKSSPAAAVERNSSLLQQTRRAVSALNLMRAVLPAQPGSGARPSLVGVGSCMRWPGPPPHTLPRNHYHPQQRTPTW